MIRSRVWQWKTRQISRIPAGDASTAHCDCGDEEETNFILTELSEPITAEDTSNLVHEP